MRDCQKCGGAVSWTQDTVKLIGGVTAHLCAACQTAYDAYIRAQPIWQAVMEADASETYYAMLAQAQQPPSFAMCRELRETWERLHTALHALGVAWLAEQPVAVQD